jgi:hypothetical protein
MPINEESRSRVAQFVAQVAMLQQAIQRDASREQVLARISLLEADVAELVDALAREDPDLSDAVKHAWGERTRVSGRK